MPVSNKTTSSKATGSMKDAGRSGRNVSVNRNSGSVKRLYTTSPKSSEKGKEDKQNKWKSGSAAGSMKDAKRSGRDVSVNRNYGSTKALYSSRAKEKEEEEKEKKNSGSAAAQKNTASYSGRKDSRETRESQQHSYDGSSEVRQDKAPATSSVKSMYNSDWMSRPEDSSRYTFESHSDKKDEDKVDVGQLAFGVVDQAYNQFVGDAIGTADFLFGTPYQKLMDYGEEKFGWEDRGENFISAYNKQFQENARKEAEYYAQNASKSEIASLINQFGPTVLALLPEVALAYLSKGSSLAANGMKAAGKTASIVNKASKLDNITDVMKNASLWGGTASTIGQTYNQAKYEGADTDEAMKYALTNGMLNFGLNTLGLMHGQAGVETLPGQLRELATPRQYLGAYGKAALHDGGEAVAQGALQRGARAIYDDNVELLSEDRSAVINPVGLFADFAAGTAGTLTTAGMHAGTRALDASANAAEARLEMAYFKDHIMGGNSSLNEKQALEQANVLRKLTHGQLLGDNEINKLDIINNKGIQNLFTRETGVPLSISDFDAKNKDVLRQKLNFAATKVKNGDATTDVNRNVLAKIGDQIYNNIAVNPKNHTYKHGNWVGKEIKTESEVFNGKPLTPNTSYVCGENNYIYQTDGSGRIQNATGVLLLKQHKGRKGMPSNQTPGKLKDDEAGHIFADMFGGSPKLLNLVSENAHVNRSDHKKVELFLQKALKNGEEVYVDYDIFYSDNHVRPDKFTITYYNGKKDEYGKMKPISVVIENPEPKPKKSENK